MLKHMISTYSMLIFLFFFLQDGSRKHFIHLFLPSLAAGLAALTAGPGFFIKSIQDSASTTMTDNEKES